eukprot:jgi/Psemu1/259081/estExt_Genewise1Plus.C_3280013
MEDEREVSRTFELDTAAASISEFIRNNLDLDPDLDDDHDNDHNNDHDSDSDEQIRTIAVPRVRAECLGRVVEFLEYYRIEELQQISGIPLEGDTFDEVIRQEWYRDFMSNERLGIRTEEAATAEGPTQCPPPLRELFMAGNYMGIERLLDLVVLKIAFQIQSKTQEEIRVYLNLPEMTDEERERVRRDHPWILED